MASKTITIKTEAYRRLLRKKRKGESFSEVILRTVRFATARDLERHLGIVSTATARSVEREVAANRKKTTEDFDKREHDLFG